MNYRVAVRGFSAVSVLLLFIFIIPACGGGGVTIDPPENRTIAELKGDDWQAFIGREVIVEGIFINDPIPMIVTDLDDVLTNSPRPFEKYIILSGDEAANISSEQAGGYKIRLEGVVEAISKDTDYSDELVAVHLSVFDILEKLTAYRPWVTEVEYVFDPDWFEDRYAVLFSGGIHGGANYARYWNDLKFMYSTLINTCGFPAENIFVLYANGTGRDTQMPVDFSATQTNLEAVFNDLEDLSSANDKIFFFMTNHGGGFNIVDTEPWNYGGQWDSNLDEGTEPIFESSWHHDLNSDGDQLDQVAWDECLFSWGGQIQDDAFEAMFEDLVYGSLIVVMEQCFSGGLIPDMSEPESNRIIMSASGEWESSWAMAPDYNYDEFSYYFTCAINGAEPDGTVVDADANADTRVSMVEAFNYAVTHDIADETPEYEDSGDGVASTGTMPSGSDGVYGANIWF